MADATYQPKTYRQQGGDRFVVASGGSLDVESGGEIDIESGGSLKIAGVAVTATAAEINAIAGGGLSAAELGVLDGVTPGTVTASKAVVVGTGKNIDFIQFGTTATAALTSGGGTSVTPLTTATADKNFLGFWFDTTATSGDSRGMYLRLYFSGAGVSGEAARIFGTVNNVTAATGGTVNGAHISLSVTGASGAVSGAGNALRATLGLGAGTTAGGTLSALQLDSDFNATANIPATAAAIRLTNSSTGVWANLMNIPNASNGTIFAAHTTQTMTHSIKIISADGTAYYVMCTNAATNRS